MARIPPKTLSEDDREVLAHLDATLKRLSMGRIRPLARLSSAIKLARAGLRDPEKPIGCYLFSGPLAWARPKWLGRWLSLGVELVRFDMSEYMEDIPIAADRRAARLCRVRSGRAFDGRHRPTPALRAAAGRNRKGASRSLQHSAAGDGSRQSDRPQRQDYRLP